MRGGEDETDGSAGRSGAARRGTGPELSGQSPKLGTGVEAGDRRSEIRVDRAEPELGLG